jgi:hypothetical protein
MLPQYVTQIEIIANNYAYDNPKSILGPLFKIL